MSNNNEIVFKNDLISLQYDDIRFGLYDSDGAYIDYLFYSEEEENPDMLANEYIKEFGSLNEVQIAARINNLFSVLQVVPNCTDKKLKGIKKQYGEEFVCRVGNTAIVIRE